MEKNVILALNQQGISTSCTVLGHSHAFACFRFSSFLLSTLILLSSCSPFELIDSGRRPQVMTEFETDIIDYNTQLEEFDRELAEAYDCLNRTETMPLTPEMFKPAPPALKDFVLAVGDTLQISIVDEEDSFADDVVIAPDGCLYYHIVQGIPAAGHTIPELTDAVEADLKKYYNEPIVTITATSALNDTYTILGRVQKPGVYPTTNPLTLREAIGKAGGLAQENYNSTTQDSPQESIVDLKLSFIVRDYKRLDVDFHDLLLNPATTQDIYVKAGDYIYLAAKAFEQVYVLGSVLAPVRLRYTNGMRLFEALASASGWTIGYPFSADVSKVLVIRGCLEKPLFVLVDLREIYNGHARDVILQPGDIIYVTNKTMRFGRQLVDLAINTFIQAFATTAAGYYGEFVWFPISFGGSSDDD